MTVKISSLYFPIYLVAAAAATAAASAATRNAEQIACVKSTTTAAAAAAATTTKSSYISSWSCACYSVCTYPVPSTTTSVIVSITS
jgi:hypothetical protein